MLEVELQDGSRERGYLINQTEGPDGQLTLQTGPGQHRLLPLSDMKFLFYPNDLSWRQRLVLALDRLQQRLPLKRMP